MSLCFIRTDESHVSFKPAAGTAYPELSPCCCPKTTEQAAFSRLRRVAVCILEGPLLMLGVGMGKRGGGRVGLRASLDQYSTHIASGGGGCRKQHLKLREKDGAQGRTT
jgi:hypothetical protein